MPRYVAFLRAINVGGRNVKMDRLRELFESLGFSNVETFIASGNVIFEWQNQDTRALERQIEATLLESLGYHVDTFIRSSQELADITAYQPFPLAELESEETTLFISFLPETPAGDAQQKLLDLQTPDDRFHIHERELYFLRRGRISDSTISGALLEKVVGLPATMRNVNTIRRLAAKYPPTA